MTFIIKKLNPEIDLELGPNKIFEKNVIEFLDELSKLIFSSKKYCKFNDLAAFAFWCRKKNINTILKNYKSNNLIIGRGWVLHICPSNVPMNFAYSFAFGLLSGNNNIVKIPSRNFFQVNYLMEAINKIIKKKKFLFIKKKLVFIKYQHNDQISAELSKIVNARLIWGGDDTVRLFKKFETKPRCIDLNFSNRVSGAIINLNSLKKLNYKDFYNLVFKFYNDSYLMDQQGCSSPQVIFWVGKKENKVIKIFWNILSDIVSKNYNFDYSLAVRKTELASDIILKEKNFKSINFENLKIVRYRLKKTEKLDKLENSFGTFLEADLDNIKKIKRYINERFQTLLYYGIKKEELLSCISKNNFNGIDRIAPLGRAFDMGHIWDGFDIISSLSRKIGE